MASIMKNGKPLPQKRIVSIVENTRNRQEVLG